MANDLVSMMEGVSVSHHGHLPAAAAYCRSLGLVELVNDLVPSRMELRPGLAVQAMVLDTLSGRSPLYHLEEFLAGQDIELLLGEPAEARLFSDTNLSRSMDAIFEAGPSRIVTRLGAKAAELFALNCKAVRYDTTSTSVWGDYPVCETAPAPPGPKLVHGHSKDHRPDLKQFMTELLCVEGGVPVFAATLDGNSSDKTSNNAMLSRLAGIMAECGLGAGAFTYVADSAMVTKKNLAGLDGIRFVTRLPANYGECGRVIETAVASGTWREIGALAETLSAASRPAASYRACESAVTLHGREYRAVVIHSSTHCKRREKRLAKAIESSDKETRARLRDIGCDFSCEKDAMDAADRATRMAGRLHLVEARVISREVRKRGRPPKNSPPATQTRYSLKNTVLKNKKAIEAEKKQAGCFVLLTNCQTSGEDALDAKELLKTYKGQHCIERDFSFLKDPLVVNDLFLKKPHRIDVLGMVLVIALIVWRLMELTMRRKVAATGGTVPGWNKQRTKRPTAYMATWLLRGIVVARKGGQRVLLTPPSQSQAEFLKAMGLCAKAYINPRYQCRMQRE